MLAQINTIIEQITSIFDLKKNQNLTKEEQFSKISDIIKNEGKFWIETGKLDTFKSLRDGSITNIKEHLDYYNNTYNELPLNKRDLNHITNIIVECNLDCDTSLSNSGNIDECIDDRNNTIAICLRDYFNSNTLIGNMMGLRKISVFIESEINKSLNNINSFK